MTRCLDYWRGQGDDGETAKELNSLAVSYRNTGDWDKARELLEEGLSRAERSGDKNRQAAILSNRGILEIDVGRPAAAIELFNRAVAVDRELETPGERRSTSSISRRPDFAPATSRTPTKSCVTWRDP